MLKKIVVFILKVLKLSFKWAKNEISAINSVLDMAISLDKKIINHHSFSLKRAYNFRPNNVITFILGSFYRAKLGQ